MGKICAYCNEYKEYDQFYICGDLKRHSDGYQAYCKECNYANFTRWRKEHRDRYNLLLFTWAKAHPRRIKHYQRKHYVKKLARQYGFI